MQRFVKALAQTIIIIVFIAGFLYVTKLVGLPWYYSLPPMAFIIFLYHLGANLPVTPVGRIVVFDNPEKEDAELWIFDGIEDPDSVIKQKKVMFEMIDRRSRK